jgi:hypothetical protein
MFRSQTAFLPWRIPHPDVAFPRSTHKEKRHEQRKMGKPVENNSTQCPLLIKKIKRKIIKFVILSRVILAALERA